MKPYRLSGRAKADVRGIWDYIGGVKGNPTAAEKQVATLFDKFHLLARHPMMGQLRSDLRPRLRTFSAGS